MGCTGSKEATPEERQLICKHMSKQMMLLCMDPALDHPDKIKISAPPDFDKVKKAAAELRKAADDAKNTGRDSGTNAGGVFGAVQAGLATVANLAGQGVGSVLGAMADGIESAVGKVESPFSNIATDVVAQKKTEIAEVFSAHIMAADVPGAFDLCRAPGGAISELLIGHAAQSIATQLRPKIDEAVKNHTGLKAWNTLIENHNSACEKAGSLQLGDKLPDLAKGSTIKLDIAEYICEQTIIAIGKKMGEEETAIRGNPAGKATTCPEIFATVFSGGDLTAKDYKAVKKAYPA